MKKLFALAGAALSLSGCVTGGNVAKLAHELRGDHASVKARIVTPWGTADFERTNPAEPGKP